MYYDEKNKSHWKGVIPLDEAIYISAEKTSRGQAHERVGLGKSAWISQDEQGSAESPTYTEHESRHGKHHYTFQVSISPLQFFFFFFFSPVLFYSINSFMMSHHVFISL